MTQLNYTKIALTAIPSFRKVLKFVNSICTATTLTEVATTGTATKEAATTGFS